MSDLRAARSWRPLDPVHLPVVTDLARVCLSADGGQPFAADAAFVSRCYLSGAQTLACWDGASLVCVSSLRPIDASADGQIRAITTGLVHPAWRRCGIGGHAFDWAARQVGRGELRAESEALSDGAHALYLSRGLDQVFAEDVMRLAPHTHVPAAQPPEGVTLSSWGDADPARFYAVYHAAFSERPGYPGWPRERWIEWIAGDEDFRPRWTLLATLAGADVGYVAAEATGWIAQVGVVPRARGKDIGATLIGEAVRLMRSAGETTITLNVNVNNPHAAALYRRLGFARTGSRARYEGAA